MINLHGFGGSNYYRLVKACLVAKGMEFTEVKAMPSQEDDYLTKSPMGKVPCIEVNGTFISETYAIADYLEQLQPQPALLPSDLVARAKTLELIRHIELDVELVARRVLPAAFFGATASEETTKRTRKDLARGLASLERVLVADPFAAGKDFTLADLYVFYTFVLAVPIAQKIWGEDILADHPRISELMARLADHPAIAAVEAANQ